jgi:hypothetical protein
MDTLKRSALVTMAGFTAQPPGMTDEEVRKLAVSRCPERFYRSNGGWVPDPVRSDPPPAA